MTDPGRTAAGRLLSIRRVSLSLAAGVAVAAVAVVLGAPELSALLGWIVTAGLILAGVWRISWPQDPAGTERLAEAESRSRSTDPAVLIVVTNLGQPS
ncbi:hypothetical protein [Catenuloplanes indicus]|uniref:Uncharacterized protein n=1 Tax=Catenuloplanes indicus TaxID=137267 RepID=A0AAE3W9V4_9ACTN|nr:hypothetical protein [Catenuloplanes indicus]MDQ0371137.1 hypothetical protein [Catenuloplanes indicus]